MTSILIFIFSCFLLFFVSTKTTRLLANTPREAFWIFAGATYLQISSIPLFLSVFMYLNIKGFLFCQILLTLSLAFKKYEKIFFFKASNLNGLEKGLFVLVLVLIFIHFSQRINLPLFIGDVLYYHASRPLYWIQNHSMAAYPTMNDRQIVFAFGTDLIFMWPVLFTKSEFIGRMIYWTGFPAATIGFYAVMRAIHCSKKTSILGILIFISTPIIYFFGLTLEPLIWVSFFALGSGYWVVRIAQAPSHRSKFIFFLGIYCILTGNAKNYGIALIPAGAASIIIIQSLSKNNNQFTKILKSLGIYISAIFTGLLLSGFGFLLIQNWVLFGNPVSSEGRLNENIAEFSFYQFYVHTIRIFSILAEIPIPFGNQSFMEFGNWIIHLLKADTPLPKEIEWEWVGHYRYNVPQWPGLRNFGIAGVFILLAPVLAVISIIKQTNNISFKNAIIKSEKLPFIIITFTLFFLTAYFLRWVNTGTRSFIAPGVVCILAFSLSFIDKKYITKEIFNVILLCSLIFYTLFVIHNGHQLAKLLNMTGLSWVNINYTRLRPHKLINEKVPENATLILLIHGGFKDYTTFGKQYTRKVIQVTSSFDKNKINEALHKYPNSYIYIHKNRYKDIDFNWLQNNKNVLFITEDTNAKLFKFIHSK